MKKNTTTGLPTSSEKLVRRFAPLLGGVVAYEFGSPQDQTYKASREIAPGCGGLTVETLIRVEHHHTNAVIGANQSVFDCPHAETSSPRWLAVCWFMTCSRVLVGVQLEIVDDGTHRVTAGGIVGDADVNMLLGAFRDQYPFLYALIYCHDCPKDWPDHIKPLSWVLDFIETLEPTKRWGGE